MADERVDPREAELVEDMILDAMDYIHGKGSQEIVRALQESVSTSDTLAAISYKVVKGVADKHAKNARVEMDMDMLMGVATEVIDMTTEVATAAGQIGEGSNEKQLKEDTLLRLTTLHGEQLEGEDGFDADMKQAAATDLRDYMSDGGTQKAFDYVNQRARSEGLNPQDMMRAGNEAALGRKNPLSEAVTEGLQQQQEDRMPAAGGLMDTQPQPPTSAYGEGSPQGPPPPPPRDVQGQGLMGGSAPSAPSPLPQGEGLIPSGLPPQEDPNAAILPPGNGRR